MARCSCLKGTTTRSGPACRCSEVAADMCPLSMTTDHTVTSVSHPTALLAAGAPAGISCCRCSASSSPATSASQDMSSQAFRQKALLACSPLWGQQLLGL